MSTVAVPIPASAPVATERRFFVVAAALAVVVSLFGFTQRYFLPLAAGTLQIPRLVHVHGLLMWAWTALFFVQSWLVYTGRLRRHRAFGLGGVALLTLCVWTGATIAILQLDTRLAAGGGDAARAFALMPISLSVAMAVLFVAAIAQARRPEAHARLMLLVTLVALQPALARIVGMVNGRQGLQNAIAAGTIVLALIGVAMLRDRLQRGSVHPAYLWGGAFVLLLHGVRTAFHDSPVWYGIADALVAMAY